MKSNRKRAALITAIVIIALIVISAIALRIIFTRERLIALVIPRAEKALDAEIEIGDIGIEFPFGFGVEVENLQFRKKLDEARELSFNSDKVEIKASLMSLIRRKPRISRTAVSGCRIELSGAGAPRMAAEGIRSTMSLNPDGARYLVDYDIRIDSLTVKPEGEGDRTGAADIAIRGRAETDLSSGNAEEGLFPEAVVETDIEIGEFLIPAEIPKTFIKGTFNLDGLEIRSDNLNIRSGGIVSDISCKLLFDSSSQSIRRIDFDSGTKADIGEIGSMAGAEGITVDGEVDLGLSGFLNLDRFGGSGFPGPEAISLDGKIAVRKMAVDAGEKIPAVSELELSGSIDQYGISELESGFILGGQRLELSGEMLKIFPALYELYLLGSGEDGGKLAPEKLGTLFDEIRTDSRIVARLTGERFDISPFIPESKDEENETGEAPDVSDPGSAFDLSSNPAVANPFTFLALKNSRLVLGMKTLETPYGVFEGVRAEIQAENGFVRIRPLEAGYSGGMIKSASSFDLGNLVVIPVVANFSAENIKAEKLLSHFFGSTEIIDGEFNLNGTGRLSLTPHAGPLNSLHARAVLNSERGGVNFSKFISPISAAAGIDLSKYENFRFRSCDGDLLVSNGRMLIRKLEMVSVDGRIEGSGTVGFDKNLDCRASLIIPPDAQKRMKDLRKLGDIVEYLKDGQGNLVISFDIGGSMASPAVSLDQSGIREKAKEKLADELKKKAVEKLKDLF